LEAEDSVEAVLEDLAAAAVAVGVPVVDGNGLFSGFFYCGNERFKINLNRYTSC
jgi:hypothetical protein